MDPIELAVQLAAARREIALKDREIVLKDAKIASLEAQVELLLEAAVQPRLRVVSDSKVVPIRPGLFAPTTGEAS